MPTLEEIEKVRQEIMRFHELLNIMRQNLDDGERAYAQLFSNCSPEDMKNMKQKDLQWKVAEEMVGDVSQLQRAVSHLRFDARNLEHAFEELHDIIVSAQ
jgi:hypothetical protein